MRPGGTAFKNMFELLEMIFDVFSDGWCDFNVSTGVLKPHKCTFPSQTRKIVELAQIAAVRNKLISRGPILQLARSDNRSTLARTRNAHLVAIFGNGAAR